MTQARLMTAALNRRMKDIKERLADKSIDEKIAAYQKIIIRNDGKQRGGISQAAAECAKRAIIELRLSQIK